MPVTPADLYERHHLAIFRYLLRVTGSRDEAEDLTQEVFLRVVKAAHGYEDRDRERAWLFRIARNLRIDRSRQAQRTPSADSLAGADVAETAQQGLRVSLLSALDDLEGDDREAFVLAEIGGLSYADIAAICDTSPAAVRSRIYRARLALRAALECPTGQRRVLLRGDHE